MKWQGRTVFCIASGPSLTSLDCELVRFCGQPTVVTNTTFRLCPWADVLFGFDAMWWKHYQEEVKTFQGEKLCSSPLAEKYGATRCVPGFRNSGAAAIALAMGRGASKVVLLGYDSSFKGTRRHWHEDHPKGLGNAEMMGDWARQFSMVATAAERRGVEILNASRRTVLSCFPRVSLEDVLL